MTTPKLALLKRWKIKAVDRLRYSTILIELKAILALGKAWAARRAPARLARFSEAYRLTSIRRIEDASLRGIRPSIETGQIADWVEGRSDWRRFAKAFDRPLVNRSLVLKAPGPNGEKGVISLAFEENLFRIIYHIDNLAELNSQYDLILASSWSPADYAVLGFALTRWKGPLFVQSSNIQEIPKLEHFHPRIVTLPTLACDWLDPSAYKPRPHSDRNIDILMVANWAPFKRHWLLFEALADLPVSTRVTLIGQPQDSSTVETVKAQARLFGVRQKIEFCDSLLIEEVQLKQIDSRVAVILSKREGSCVTVIEAMLAGTPVGLIRGARVGSTRYVNEKTGVLFNSSRLGPQLAAFLERSAEYRPREWALANLTCQISTRKVDAVLRHQSELRGLPWTRDLATQCWKPNPIYFDHAQKEMLNSAIGELNQRYPEVFSL